MKNVDKTIEKLCNWIQEELESESKNRKIEVIPDAVNALAGLVAARAKYPMISRNQRDRL